MVKKTSLHVLEAVLEFLFDLPHNLFMWLWVYPVEQPYWWVRGRIEVALASRQLRRRSGK